MGTSVAWGYYKKLVNNKHPGLTSMDSDDEEDLLMLSMALDEMDEEEDGDVRKEEWFRSRLNWNEHVRKLEHEGLFERKYRMTLRAFTKLVDTLRPHLNHHSWKRKKSINPVPIEVMVSSAIRLLAGGSYLDIYETHGMCVAWLYQVRDKVIDAILSSEDLHIKFPSTQEELDNVRVGFMQASTNNLLHKCLGVKDGLLQQINCPSVEECDGNQEGYFSGHYQTYGLNCQGMCDSWLRFTFFAVAAPGQVPDQVAIERTKFKQILDLIPDFHYILADPAYTLSNKILVPFTGSQRDSPENDSFNFHLSQLRIRIEMAFGRLVGKWRILRSPLQQGTLEKNIKIIMACATLHNYVINEDMDLSIDPTTLTNDYHDISPLQTRNGVMNHLGYLPTVEPFHDVPGTSEMRAVIVEYIKERRIVRPQYNVDRNTQVTQ